MKPSYLQLTYGQVALAASLILINAGISYFLRLRLEKTLLIAAVRTFVQLLLVGFVLQWVFEMNRWQLVLSLGLLMALVAGAAAVNRVDRRYPGVFIDCVVSMWASSWLITAVALFAIVRVEPWYHPQYAIPLLGMILGNTLNGISLGLSRLGDELATHRAQVNMLLSLGASRWEAAQPFVSRALRHGMIPIVNSMVIVGIVSLPGMMTGQLLAGVSPLEAVKYQIVIMFLIASGTA